MVVRAVSVMFLSVYLMAGNHYIKFYYGGNGLEFESVQIYLEEEHD